ncbi:MAG: hypothetical protein H6R19_1699 [Proteobacteria bacterium]|nr:hypothetical protein [Pseudomonadota bacterium]
MRWLSDSVKWAAIANMAAQIIGMLGQLIFIPIYLHAWGGEKYGSWMICVGVTAYAAILDFGVSQAASNEMIASIAKRDQKTAQIWSSLAFWVAIGMSLAVGLMGICAAPYAIDFLGNRLGAGDSSQALYFCVVIQLALLVTFNMYICLIRAAGANATASWISVLAIFLEVVIPPCIALGGGTLAQAAAGLVVPRLLGLVICGYALRALAPWATVTVASREYLVRAKEILIPSAANLLQPGGVALFLQGSLVVIGSMLGPQVAAAFGVARTVSRLPFQLCYVFTRAQMPNLTKSISASDKEGFLRSFKPVVLIYFCLTVPMLFCFAIFGEWFLRAWTHETLSFSFALVGGLALCSVLHSGWHMLSAPLVARNLHGGFSVAYFVLVSVSLCALNAMPNLASCVALIAIMEFFALIVSWRQFKSLVFLRF